MHPDGLFGMYLRLNLRENHRSWGFSPGSNLGIDIVRYIEVMTLHFSLFSLKEFRIGNTLLRSTT